MTVMRTYARRVIDEHLCGYGLCGPHDINDSEWLIRKKKYYGSDKRPVAPIIDVVEIGILYRSGCIHGVATSG